MLSKNFDLTSTPETHDRLTDLIKHDIAQETRGETHLFELNQLLAECR